jgi:hypothetical protein
MDKDKKEMLARIATMEAELEQLRKLAETKKGTRWRPEPNQKYYSIFAAGDVTMILAKRSLPDDGLDRLYLIGNVYKTEKEAERATRITEAKRRVLDLILKYNEGWTPDWLKYSEKKWAIKLIYKNPTASYWFNDKYLPDSYYIETPEVVSKVIEEAGDDIYALFDMEKADLEKE